MNDRSLAFVGNIPKPAAPNGDPNNGLAAAAAAAAAVDGSRPPQYASKTQTTEISITDHFFCKREHSHSIQETLLPNIPNKEAAFSNELGSFTSMGGCLLLLLLFLCLLLLPLPFSLSMIVG